MPTRLHQLTNDIWRDIKDEYGDLLPSIATVDAELEMWQLTTESLSEDDLCQLLTHTDTMFPNIHTIFYVLLTMPVSTATAERSFSCLRRLKTYLRSTTKATRLSSLALMNIHHDIPINSDNVLRDFDACGIHRLPLS